MAPHASFLMPLNGALRGTLPNPRLATLDEPPLIRLGPIVATGNCYLYIAKVACVVASVKLVSDTATTSGFETGWIIQVRNLTAGNNLRSSAYETEFSGDFTADVPRDLGVNQNLALAAGAVLRLEFIKNGAATNMAETMARVDARPVD